MNIDRDGVTISFDDTGDGTPVVLLHGWPDERGSGVTRCRRWPRPATA